MYHAKEQKHEIIGISSALDSRHTGPAEVRSSVMAKYISFTSDSFSHKYTCQKEEKRKAV